MRNSPLVLLLFLPFFLSACAGLDVRDFGLNGEGSGGDRAEEAIREALRVGTERTVERTGQEDGYWGNQAIRIGLPQELRQAGDVLRSAGLGSQVDDLERRMNRAAEAAAREAAPVFVSAIRGMQPSDVHAVLRGDDDAATQYLRGASESDLRERYAPVVREHMEGAGVYRVYQPLRDAASRIPGMADLDVDLDRYVTDHALDGLFTILADEERRIREDPAARTTQLLREYFGSS
ncbi:MULTISPECIES: DUF4197 domain-containing protein [unclassified Thioalkalivibrio]|uniref:DUF4197 domain-containing protein n=1 Tax=unclassified Thioalkalivibrio TaxID=2621013 RepID=UPI00036E9241|nr:MULTISPECIES: DUF4197 domain-containing protein [unclassified Thioalkalivibrio]